MANSPEVTSNTHAPVTQLVAMLLSLIPLQTLGLLQVCNPHNLQTCCANKVHSLTVLGGDWQLYAARQAIMVISISIAVAGK
jgi:hypothetical protein